MKNEQRNTTNFEKLQSLDNMVNVQAVLCLAMVLSQAAGKKDHSVEELREILNESVENIISILTDMKEETGKQATSLEGLKERMGNLEVTWPSGSYCILANGECPAGQFN